MHFIFYMAYALESMNKTKEVIMKRIFTLISFLAITFSALADLRPSRLSVTSLYRAPIHVMVDGRWIQDYNNEIRISNLNPGLHRVHIYSIENKRGVFGNNKVREELIYNGAVNVRSGFHTTLVVQRNGRVYTEDRPMDNRNDRDKWNKKDRRDRDNRYGDRDDDNWNDKDRRDRDDDYDHRNNDDKWRQPMNYNMFEQLKQQLRRESFDNRKLDIVKSALLQNRVSADQVKDLARQFDFERSKLEFAKYAYRFTTDRSNYFIVNDVFDFGNSKTELTHYIANYRD